MSEPTPTPWGVWNETDVFTAYPGQNDGLQIADCSADMGVDPVTYESVLPMLERKANAQFIVRACNAHEDLLEAAKLEEQATAHWEKCEACEPSPGMPCNVYLNLRRDAEIKRQAGLAKAEGR